MEIGPDKTFVITYNPNAFQREVKKKGLTLEVVENFKYLGSNISNVISKPKICMSLPMRKSVFGVFDQVRLKPACSDDETS